MKDKRSLISLAIVLLASSAVLYVLHFLVFRDLHNLAFYTFMDVAFMPVEILVVSLIVNRVLADRERRALLHKLNMVIGAFFSEVGTELLGRLRSFDASFDRTRPHLVFRPGWTAEHYRQAEDAIRALQPDIELPRGDIEGLHAFFADRRGFLLGLLENPNLLEHDAFTDLLWAVFHLAEELAARESLTALTGPDRTHLELDIQRAYTRLLCEWLEHVRHLQEDYPYLFSFASRTNPFDPEAVAAAS